MGSFGVLVVGDDWREQLESHIDSDTESRLLRCFLGTGADLLLKPGCSGWDIDSSDAFTAVSEGWAGSARWRDVDFEAMREQIALSLQDRWDAAHQLTEGERWLPWTEIRKRYPAPGKTYDSKLEKSAKDEWIAQAPLQRICRASLREFSYSEPASIDPLLLPRADYVLRGLTMGRVVPVMDAILEGTYLSDIDVNAFLAGLDENVLLTSACVKI